MKNVKMRNTHYRTLNMSRQLTNKENEKIMVEPGIWRETWKNVQNEKTHCRTWKMTRNSKKHEKGEMQTVGHGIWQEN
jgi:hypothetical protein